MANVQKAKELLQRYGEGSIDLDEETLNDLETIVKTDGVVDPSAAYSIPNIAETDESKKGRREYLIETLLSTPEVAGAMAGAKLGIKIPGGLIPKAVAGLVGAGIGGFTAHEMQQALTNAIKKEKKSTTPEQAKTILIENALGQLLMPVGTKVGVAPVVGSLGKKAYSWASNIPESIISAYETNKTPITKNVKDLLKKYFITEPEKIISEPSSRSAFKIAGIEKRRELGQKYGNMISDIKDEISLSPYIKELQQATPTANIKPLAFREAEATRQPVSDILSKMEAEHALIPPAQVERELNIYDTLSREFSQPYGAFAEKVPVNIASNIATNLNKYAYPKGALEKSSGVKAVGAELKQTFRNTDAELEALKRVSQKIERGIESDIASRTADPELYLATKDKYKKLVHDLADFKEKGGFGDYAAKVGIGLAAPEIINMGLGTKDPVIPYSPYLLGAGALATLASPQAAKAYYRGVKPVLKYGVAPANKALINQYRRELNE